ncbi:Eco57I restriction-modification methylase domain-containing protein [Vreelandella lionensis]|uniref:site-specific DNA-methyltransferase (adenine-specific) n=1 Tax=Vreelandella lionensis TaxID=1144478 RepID=A0ABW8BS77_9GAMM
MNLFNRKTLQRHLSPATIPASHLEALEGWKDLILSKRIRRIKETSLHGQFTSQIVEGVLGYHGPGQSAEYTVSSEQGILRGSVDLALGHFGGTTPDILAPFELKGADTRNLDAIMPGRNKSPVQQAWEYAVNARGVKWVLVSNYIELRLYGFGEGTSDYEIFQLDELTDPQEYARFMLLLSAENLLSGRTLELLKESQREDKDITEKLYQDYKDLRQKLIAAVNVAEENIAPLEAIAIAQKILDRVLFIAFAEDTGLLPRETLSNAFKSHNLYNPSPVWDNFKGLFDAINLGNKELKIPRYNGGLFRPDEVIDNLSLPNTVCEGFNILGDYDFASEVSVTVLGHIFEQSITDVERLKAVARGEAEEPVRGSGTSGRRKRDGVIYTPDYIARFIVEETLGTHFEETFKSIIQEYAKKGATLSDYAKIPWRRKTAELEAWQAYREFLKTLRIVDPACGSGVFLIMSFDFLKSELTRVNNKINSLEGKDGYTEDLFDPDSEILTNNLFGVDVNAESVEITKLSLWIKTARQGKVLDSLDGNIRVGDSLIEDSNFAYLEHGFTWANAFPKVFSEGGFDIVLGNPPYVRMELLKTLKPYLEARYRVSSDRADLYCYFYEQGLRLLKPGGRMGYISSNTFFKTGSGKPLRNYLRKEATIETIVDFGDLQIFKGVTTYPAILTMKSSPLPEGHELRFWKVDRLPENNFHATWEAAAGLYPQDALGSGSWELENPALRSLREKIKADKKTLKECYGSPLYGIKTGLNDAFIIDTQTKERLCTQDSRSAELLRPILKGNELSRWRTEPKGNWIIYIPKKRVKIDDYPAIRDWLLPFKERLESRATKQEWFELQQAQEAYIPAFEARKIAYIEVCNRGPFSLEKKGYYQEATTFLIPSDDLALLALLNSNVAWFFFTGATTVFRGGYFRMKNQFVEILPIPEISNVKEKKLCKFAQQAQELAERRLERQIELTRRIPDLCPIGREPKMNTKLHEWWTLPDFAAFRAEVKKVFKSDIPLSERTEWEDWINRNKADISRLTSEIAQVESQINSLVYDLFELTIDEIALLEASI